MTQVTIEMPSSQQQQHSSDNNNGNDRSLAFTGVGVQEKFVPITALLEMWASRLGVLMCGWVVLMLVQGGILPTVETKDRVFITVLFFLVCFRCWHYFYPHDTGSLTKATQSLSADNTQQLALPIDFIRRLFYWWNLLSVMTCVVLSMMRLASQDFGQTEVAKKGARDFALNVFYGLTLIEALVLLFVLTFVKIMAMQRTVTEALFEGAKHSQPAPPTLSLPAPATLSQPAPATLSLPAPATLSQPAPPMLPQPAPAPLPPTHTPPLSQIGAPKKGKIRQPQPAPAPLPPTHTPPLSQIGAPKKGKIRQPQPAPAPLPPTHTPPLSLIGPPKGPPRRGMIKHRILCKLSDYDLQ